MLAALPAAALALVIAPSATAKKQPPVTWADVFGNPTIKQVTVLDTDEFAAQDSEGAEAGVCWSTTYSMNKSGWWGYWNLYQTTRWCGNGSVVTYRSSFANADAGGSCYRAWGPDTWKTYGGAGYGTVRVKSQAGFNCIGGWFNGSPWMENAFTGYGASWNYAWSEG